MGVAVGTDTVPDELVGLEFEPACQLPAHDGDAPPAAYTLTFLRCGDLVLICRPCAERLTREFADASAPCRCGAGHIELAWVQCLVCNCNFIGPITDLLKIGPMKAGS